MSLWGTCFSWLLCGKVGPTRQSYPMSKALEIGGGGGGRERTFMNWAARSTIREGDQ